MDPPFGVEEPSSSVPHPGRMGHHPIDCVSVINRKREALRAHRSQISEDWPQLTLPDDVMKQFADEFFQLVISRTLPVLPETDLFAGITA